MAQDLETIKYIRNTPVKTKEELNYFLIKFLGVHLASKPLEDGNSCPLDFVWDIYNTALNNDIQEGDITNFLAIAARGSQKTLSCGVLITLLLMHDRFRDIVHMASIAPQSRVLFDIWLQKFAGMEFMKDVFPKLTMRSTTSFTGRILSVTHGTLDAVNAHHGGTLMQDEVDLTDPIVFDESKGMLVSSKGKPPINVMISSRKFALGNIQAILDKIEEDENYAKSIKIHRWGQLENTARCEDKRSGNFGTDIMVDDERLLAVSMKEFETFVPVEQKKFRMLKGYENCLDCGIFSFCQGKLKGQTTNPHLTPINVAVNFFRGNSTEFFLSQRLGRKPSARGLVYTNYSPQKHDKSIQEMTELITGDAEKAKVTTSLIGLIPIIKALEMPIYIGVDFGFNHPAATLLTIDKQYRSYVIDEIAGEDFAGLAAREFAYVCINRWGAFPINSIFPDVAEPGSIKEWQIAWQGKTFVSTTTNKDKDYGINLVRNRFTKPGSGEPMLFIGKHCHNTRRELRGYQYKIDRKDQQVLDRVLDKNNHCLDSVRYILSTLIGATPISISFGDDVQQNATQQNMVYSRDGFPTFIQAPTGEELLKYSGKQLPIKVEEEAPKKNASWNFTFGDN